MDIAFFIMVGVVIGWHIPQPAWVAPLFTWIKNQAIKQFTK